MLIDKLSLGTAQFGLNYGIANKKGKIPKNETFEILGYACNSGVDTIDTAHAYGESEEIIGEFIAHTKSDFKVISKLPFLEKKHSDIKRIIYTSLSRLRMKDIYGYLVHGFKDFLEDHTLWNVLEDLKENKIIKNIGFSIYKIEELESILGEDVNLDILQVPYSVFDRRFERFFPILKEKNIKIYTRSIFLQGLAFLGRNDLSDNLLGARGYLKRLRDLAIENRVPISALCLNFVLLNPYVDNAIIGVDNRAH